MYSQLSHVFGHLAQLPNVLLHSSATTIPSNNGFHNNLQSTTRTAAVERPYSPCRLLSLPAELRETIWQLVFTRTSRYVEDPGRICSQGVDIANARGPTLDLLLTCRQIYAEARSLYNAEFYKYWSTEHFFIRCRNEEDHEDDDDYDGPVNPVEHIPYIKQKLRLIEFLWVLGERWESFYDHGLWRLLSANQPFELRQFCIRVPRRTKHTELQQYRPSTRVWAGGRVKVIELRHGLTPKQIEEVKAVVGRYELTVEEVGLVANW